MSDPLDMEPFEALLALAASIIIIIAALWLGGIL